MAEPVELRVNPEFYSEVVGSIRDLTTAVEAALVATRALLAVLEQEDPTATQEGPTERTAGSQGPPVPPPVSQVQEDPLSALSGATSGGTVNPA